MQLTKVTNIGGKVEYVNLEQVVRVEICEHDESHYDLFFSDGAVTHIALTEEKIVALVTNAV